MRLRGKKEAIVLLIGDLLSFFLALWLALALRSFSLPSWKLMSPHLEAFCWIFAIWIVVFYIANLYHHRTATLFRNRLAVLITNTQLINSLIALVFFYFVRSFGITPKTTLFINLILTLGLLLWWRLYLVVWLTPRRQEQIIFLSAGKEVEELRQELENNSQYQITAPIQTVHSFKPSSAATIAVNLYEEKRPEFLSFLSRLLFSGARVVGVQDLYEDVFDRVPLNLVEERWLLENVSNHPKSVYDLFKRLMDLVLSLVIFTISIPLYPFIWLAIKLDDRGPIFYTEPRVGRHGRFFMVPKFRSMSTEDDLSIRKVTRVGAFLRRSRFDELPQLWSIVLGQQSLIGPRPERPDYVKLYEQQIPYYSARHLLKPGLSGWAQIHQTKHPHFQLQVDATREKLSYDLYYLKNRSIWLDISIALKTIKTILSRSGL